MLLNPGLSWEIFYLVHLEHSITPPQIIIDDVLRFLFVKSEWAILEIMQGYTKI